jgi:hypothetical protein
MKTKTGLQKPISSIFNGMGQTDFTENNGAEVPSASSVPSQANNSPDPSGIADIADRNMAEPPMKTQAAPMGYADLTPVAIDSKPKESAWLKTFLPPVAAVAIAVLLVVITANYMGVFTKYEVTTAVEPPVIQQPQIVESTPIMIDWETPEELPESSRDLTQQNVTEDSVESAIIVKGILHSEDKTLAIIGSRILKVGDTVAGAKIINIDRKTVEFARDDKSWTQTVQ